MFIYCVLFICVLFVLNDIVIFIFQQIKTVYLQTVFNNNVSNKNVTIISYILSCTCAYFVYISLITIVCICLFFL